MASPLTRPAKVLFDLGTGTTPSFIGTSKNFSRDPVPGAFTFKHGQQQYLVASNLGNSCRK